MLQGFGAGFVLAYEYASGIFIEQCLIMRYHDYGCTSFPVYACKQTHYTFGSLVVQISGRLVRQYHFRPVKQGAGYGYPLLLSTGKLVRHPVGFVCHADSFKHFRNPPVYFRTVLPSGSLEHEIQVFLHASVHEKLEVLEYHAEMPPQIRDVLFPHFPEIVAAYCPFPSGKGIFGYHCPYD